MVLSSGPDIFYKASSKEGLCYPYFSQLRSVYIMGHYKDNYPLLFKVVFDKGQKASSKESYYHGHFGTTVYQLGHNSSIAGGFNATTLQQQCGTKTLWNVVVLNPAHSELNTTKLDMTQLDLRVKTFNFDHPHMHLIINYIYLYPYTFLYTIKTINLKFEFFY